MGEFLNFCNCPLSKKRKILFAIARYQRKETDINKKNLSYAIYLFATPKDTKDWKWNFSLPSLSCIFAPCFASKPFPGRKVITIIGLPIDDKVGGTTWMVSISSHRKKKVVLRPKRSAWNPIILDDKNRRPWRGTRLHVCVRKADAKNKIRPWVMMHVFL